MLRLKVNGMTCGHCVQAVKKAVEGVAPEAIVDVSLEKGEVTISDNKAIAADKISHAIAEQGYEVTPLTA